MSSVTIKSEIEKLTFGITDEIERQRIIGNYFREKTHALNTVSQFCRMTSWTMLLEG